jgi:5-methyltetrahydropteroyltriglutamate--homocysteine methyltransferase
MPEMSIPIEPIGSIPRPQNLIDPMSRWNGGEITREAVDAVAQAAISDTIRRVRGHRVAVITEGEESNPSFATWSVDSLTVLEPGVKAAPQWSRLAGASNKAESLIST